MTTHDFGHNFARSRRSRVPSWPTTPIPQEPQTNFPQTSNHQQPLLVFLLCPLTSLFLFFFEPSSSNLIIRQRHDSTLRYYDVSRTSKAGRVEGRGRWSARITHSSTVTCEDSELRIISVRDVIIERAASTDVRIRTTLYGSYCQFEFRHVSHRILIFSFRVPEDSWKIIDLLHLNSWTLQTHASSLHFFDDPLLYGIR